MYLPKEVHPVISVELTQPHTIKEEPSYISSGFSSTNSWCPSHRISCKCNLTNRSIPALPWHAGHLNVSGRNSLEYETGVLVAHHLATARPLQKEVRAITGEGT
ncbi:hypothetical protein AVEN_190053-1 [Araneus ventricosus]|uniref:Uncharacterized protein n=1 Tax=Araneus ventricosus TaxID=182803 RepID=A0A4Y2MP00_ARAVE|nr:hypothetical protein AVEN_190053-1 [Araneus ventricosus]